MKKSFSYWLTNVFLPYYMGWTIFGICVALLIGTGMYYSIFTPKPDIEYGVFTKFAVSARGLEPLGEKIAQIADDPNGDGKFIASPTISFTAAQGNDEYAQSQFAVVQMALLDDDINLLIMDKETLNYFLSNDYVENLSALSSDLPDVKYLRFDDKPIYTELGLEENDGVYIAMKFYKPELDKNESYVKKYKAALKVALELTQTAGGAEFLGHE